MLNADRIDIRSRAAVLLGEVRLESGRHASRADGMCAMEAAAWLAGLDHDDAASCVDPVIAIYVRAINDRMDHMTRQRLKRFAPDFVDSAHQDAETQRAMQLSHAASAHFLPAALRAAGLVGDADAVRRASAQAEHTAVFRGALERASRRVSAKARARGFDTLLGMVGAARADWALLEAVRAGCVLAQPNTPPEHATDVATPAAEVIAESARVDSRLWGDALRLLEKLIAPMAERAAA